MSEWTDPSLVSEQYASEVNLQARQAIYASATGPDARELVFEAVAAAAPERVLEVGGGQGELAERIVRELAVSLAFVDQSERMVELARARGLDAQVGDVQSLPFADGSFDVAVAAWMLYHARDVDRALGELARVLRPGGSLVAVTNGNDHLRELRELAGDAWWSTLGFSRENGREQLERHFARVESVDADGWVEIPTDEAIVDYLRSLARFEPPEVLPPHDLPLRVRRRPTVFVATR
jgi:SAM-dependent methyltransferase